MEAARHFYREVLGLPEIPRPKTFDFVVYWFDLGAQQICANLPFRFTTFSGALAAADMTFGGFTGLLPDCSGRGAPPCHDRRHDSEATDPAQ